MQRDTRRRRVSPGEPGLLLYTLRGVLSKIFPGSAQRARSDRNFRDPPLELQFHDVAVMVHVSGPRKGRTQETRYHKKDGKHCLCFPPPVCCILCTHPGEPLNQISITFHYHYVSCSHSRGDNGPRVSSIKKLRERERRDARGGDRRQGGGRIELKGNCCVDSSRIRRLENAGKSSFASRYVMPALCCPRHVRGRLMNLK